MAILIALTIGLVEWIVVWALGAKSIDAFLIAIALVLIGVVIHFTTPLINRLLKP